MNIILPRLLWYQLPVVAALEDDKHKFVTFLASRRIGKSLIAKCMAIRWALAGRCNIGYILPTGDLCRKFIKEICTLLNGSGAVIGSNSVDKFIQFANGSIIYFHALEAFSRGAGNYKYMVFDECAFLDDETYQSVFQPMTLETVKVYFCSTPNGIGGVFYDMYNKGNTGAGGSRYISFKCDLEESGLYDEETVQDIKDNTPQLIYEQEYMCRFLSGGISCFPNFEKRLVKVPAERTKKNYAGIDFSGAGGGSDSTILTIVNDRHETVLQKGWQNGNTTTLNEIADILNLYNITQCYAEENSMGAISIELLKKSFKKITAFQTTNESKRAIVENVIRNFEKEKGTLIDTPETRVQFSSFIMDRTKGGKITYHNLKDTIHDDRVISYCLASYCCKQHEKKGCYNIS